MIEKMSRKTFIIIVVIFFILLYVGLKLIIVYCQDLFMSNEVFDKEYGIGKVMNVETYTIDKRNETNPSYSQKTQTWAAELTPGSYNRSLNACPYQTEAEPAR